MSDDHTTSAPSRTFILSPEEGVAQALEPVLRSLPGVELVACREFEESCFTRLREQQAELLFIDVRALHYPLDDFFGRFREQAPAIKLLIVGDDDDGEFVRNLLRSGANGFINAGIAEAELARAVEHVKAGHLWVRRALLNQVASEAFELERMIELSVKERLATLNAELTPREADIFRLVLEGLSTREIAEQLELSQQSVKIYLGRLFRKFEVKNRSQLILSAFERVCPIQNMIQLFRKTLDRRREQRSLTPLIPDPLDNKAP